MCVHDLHRWAELIPVVALPHVELCVVAITVEDPQVHVAPSGLREGLDL